MTEKHLVTKYYNSLKDTQVICKLCPHNCILLNGKSGLCHTRTNIDGKIYSTVYGYPCSIHIDPIEKKPLYHFYPGKKILSFGTYGCNMFCLGCQNFDITKVDATKETIKLKHHSPEEIIKIALEKNVKFIAYTYNEPTIFFEYLIDVAKLARKKGIKNVLVSNGYINPEPLKELCKYIDATNIDIKGITENFYKEYTKTNIKPVLETIKTLHKKKIWLELTNLIIPGMNDKTEDIKELCEWIKTNVGTEVPLHFSRFYPYYHALNISPTLPQKLKEAKNIALDTGIKYVYVGNLGFLDNTVCSKCGTLLIQRDYDDTDTSRLSGQEKNKCAICKMTLPGIFI
jgi:pyruvate formate lyase activating enzyme